MSIDTMAIVPAPSENRRAIQLRVLKSPSQLSATTAPMIEQK